MYVYKYTHSHTHSLSHTHTHTHRPDFARLATLAIGDPDSVQAHVGK